MPVIVAIAILLYAIGGAWIISRTDAGKALSAVATCVIMEASDVDEEIVDDCLMRH